MADATPKFGCPWHGLWTAGGGLRLANGTVRVLQTEPAGNSDIGAFPAYGPSSIPAGADTTVFPVGDRYGDCFLVKIPDRPAAVTAVDELAAGKVWRNYGLVCGAKKLVFGVELGPDAFLYIDTAGKPWCTRVTAVTYGSYVVRLTFTEFGVFAKRPCISVSHDYPHPGGYYGDRLRYVGPQEFLAYYVAGASATGNRVLIASRITDGVSTRADFMTERRLFLSGIPGSDLQVSFDGALGSPSQPPFFSPSNADPVVYQVGDVKLLESPGGAFAGNEVFDQIVTVAGEFLQVGMRWSGSVPPVSVDVSVPGLFFVRENDIDVVVFCGEHELRLQLRSRAYLSVSLTGYWVVDHPQDVIGITNSAAPAWRSGSSKDAVPMWHVDEWPGLVMFRRVQNFLIEVYAPLGGQRFKSIALATPDGFVETGHEFGDGVSPYFTYNPETKEIHQSQSASCFF